MYSYIFHKPVYCVHFRGLLDSPTRFPPLRSNHWLSIFYVLFLKLEKYEPVRCTLITKTVTCPQSLTSIPFLKAYFNKMPRRLLNFKCFLCGVYWWRRLLEGGVYLVVTISVYFRKVMFHQDLLKKKNKYNYFELNVMDFEEKGKWNTCNSFHFYIRLFNLIKASFLLNDTLDLLKPGMQIQFCCIP